MWHNDLRHLRWIDPYLHWCHMTQGRNIDAGEEPTQEEDNMTDRDQRSGEINGTRPTLEQRRDIARCLTPKLLWADGYCASCLESGEVIDETPELNWDGTHTPGDCINCVDTAFETHAAFAYHTYCGANAHRPRFIDTVIYLRSQQEQTA